MTDARQAATVQTLRWLASQPWLDGVDGDPRPVLVEIADAVDRGGPEDWLCCPVCEETVCDECCPLAAVRERWEAERAAEGGTVPVVEGFSCNVRVVSVKSNEGGEGATAILGFEEGGGIDIRPGGPTTRTAAFQITADADQLVTEGAVLRLTLSKAA